MIKSMMESYKSSVRKVFGIVFSLKTYPDIVSLSHTSLLGFTET